MDINEFTEDFSDKIHELIATAMEQELTDATKFMTHLPVIIGVLEAQSHKLKQIYNSFVWKDDGALMSFATKIMDTKDKYKEGRSDTE